MLLSCKLPTQGTVAREEDADLAESSKSRGGCLTSVFTDSSTWGQAEPAVSHSEYLLKHSFKQGSEMAACNAMSIVENDIEMLWHHPSCLI
ncbi:hypothetical protein WJX77_001713 [Trebouxia sp. C0004]